MKERFKLPMSKGEAVSAITAAVRAEVENRYCVFKENDYVKHQVDVVAEWLTSENPKFGLMLCGGTGNGKTTFVRALQRLLNNYELHDYYNNSTYGIVIRQAMDIAYLRREDVRLWRDLCATEMLAIDDLGREPIEVSDYGNVWYPLVDLITTRYDRQLFTLITTNLTPQEIRARYGDRIADRLNEMMIKVIFKNDTYRTI